MEYTTLGSTGMEVNRICLGCMGFGGSGGGEMFDWTVDELAATSLFFSPPRDYLNDPFV